MLRRLLGAARPLAVRASAAAPLCTRVALGATVASSLVPSPSACAANGGGMPLGLPTSLPSLPSITDVSMLQVELLTVSGLSGYTAGYADADVLLGDYSEKSDGFAVGRTLLVVLTNRNPVGIIEALEEATGLGALIDHVGGPTEPAFLAVVLAAGLFLGLVLGPARLGMALMLV